MLWYDVGLKESFESNTANQIFSNSYSKTAPYASLLLAYARSFRKTLPEACTELWFAFNSTGGYAAQYNCFMELLDASLSSLLFLGNPAGGSAFYLSLGGTYVADMIPYLAANVRTEIHYKRTATLVTVDIWQEDILKYSYSGTIGIGTTGVAYFQASTSSSAYTHYYWDFVASSEGRVKGFKPIVVPLSSAGLKNTAHPIEYAGNYTAATSGSLTTGYTVLVNAAAATPGTLKKVVATFTASGTAYIGVLTKNASDATKYTLKYVSGAITVAAAETTFASGVDFATTEDWVLTANDRIAIYCTGSAVLAYYSSGSNTGYTYSGNAMADATERTFTATANKPCIRMLFEATDKTRSYMITDATAELNYNEYEEGNHYLEMQAADEGVMCNINNMPKTAIYVKSVKVSARGLTGSDLTTAKFNLAIGNDTLSVTSALPASNGQFYGQFDNGEWSISEFNAAQLGIDAEA